jgi:phosphopantothenoylcysteine decarboxylase / phosphopantothenate---cysteine ligase
MKSFLNEKRIVVGVSGGIAAYKSPELVRILKKQGADIKIIMTQNAEEFIGALTLEALSGYEVCTGLFDGKDRGGIRHIEWAEEADAVVIAPATANIIGKLANGIADDALSTFLLAVTSPVILCPSMNTHMYESRSVQRNISKLEDDGYIIVEPEAGELACGTTGAGRLPEPHYIADRLVQAMCPKDLKGKKVLVSAGPTREAIDPVRYISNHSSGKMGYSVARAAEYRGADVTLVSGPTNLPPVAGVTMIRTTSAHEMADAVFDQAHDSDIIIKVAAVADYHPKHISEHKIKKEEDALDLALDKNPDILKELGARKKDQFLVGFAAETRDLDQNAKKKAEEKNLDMIVGNIVGGPSSGFGSDTNQVTFYYKDGTKENLPEIPKDEVAHTLLDRILERLERG